MKVYSDATLPEVQLPLLASAGIDDEDGDVRTARRKGTISAAVQVADAPSSFSRWRPASMTKILRHSLRAAALGAVLAIAGLSTVRADEPAPPLKPAISDDAASAISQMAGTLSARDLSVTVRTIRVYLDESGQSLHIFHTLHIVARRPDQIAVEFNGDDGKQQLFYDGKAAAVFLPDSNQYTVMPASGSISSVVAEAADKLNVDFPLAALFAESPDKVLLGDAMAARQVGTATVDGVECRHLFFSQKSGIDIELWVEKNDAATPHRLTVTYRLLPGQPSFIAEFMDWNTKANPSDSEFVFQPPSDAKKIELNQAAAPTTEDAK